jgi:hypothetical protein
MKWSILRAATPKIEFRSADLGIGVKYIFVNAPFTVLDWKILERVEEGGNSRNNQHFTHNVLRHQKN